MQEGVANVTACYLRQSWEDETYVVTRIEAMLADKPDALRGVERVIKEMSASRACSTRRFSVRLSSSRQRKNCCC